jgi:hypothetical protein
MGKRLLIYDGTPKPGERALRAAWAYGAKLYRTLGFIDAAHGARDWSGALDWALTQVRSGELIELQFWGHGTWGRALIADNVLDVEALGTKSPLYTRLQLLRARMQPAAKSLIWFRTCETFGADKGQLFASELANFTQSRVAGHTHIIGAIQSGLHGLYPGKKPHWDAAEGLQGGTAAAPTQARMSAPTAINTIHFLQSSIPLDWFGA